MIRKYQLINDGQYKLNKISLERCFMRVAVIGAGIAGLSCAIVLEKNGILPTVFEKTSFIGEREQHVGAILNIMNRPVKDPLKYIKQTFDIEITPINTVNILTHYSPNQKTSITGNFGYFTKRDQEENSIKKQLFAQLKKTEVLLNREVNYKQLIGEYDYVVAADGKPDIAEELGCWTDWIRGYIKGAVIEGEFNPNELVIWLDQTYCKNGYAYLTPFSSKKASISLYVPYTDVNEIDHYWDKFIQKEQIKSRIVETFKVYHCSGQVYPHRVDNLFLAGNTGGAIDPFLGFGQIKSISMGGMAARAIIEGSDYEKLIRQFYKSTLNLYELRKSFNTITNKQFDFIVKSLGFPGVKLIIYDTPLNVIKYGAFVLKWKRKIKGIQ